MNATTKVLIEIIGNTGYSVMTGVDSHGNSVVEATDECTHEKLVVRANDLYTAASVASSACA